MDGSIQGRGTTHGRKVRVSFVTAKGVPPLGSSSVPTVVHEITRRCVDRLDTRIIGGSLARDARKEAYGIGYKEIPDRVDRRLWDPLCQQLESRRAVPTNAYLQRAYHLPFAVRATLHMAHRSTDLVVSLHFPQWLRLAKVTMPKSRRAVWFHSADPVGAGSHLLDDIARSDGIIACSAFVAERIIDAVPAVRGRAHVVYNGFDPFRFQPPRTWPTTDHPNILYVGAVAPEKGVHLLVDAFSRIAESNPDVTLTLVGAVGSVPTVLASAPTRRIAEIGDLPADFRSELVRRAGRAASRLRFTGPLLGDDLVREYGSASVCVLPSLYHEGFGLPVVEAMACGVPVVVTRSGGMPELVEHDISGLIVAPGDVDELVAALVRVITDHHTARAMSRCAAEQAHRRFAWESSAAALISAVDEIVSAPAA